MNSAPQKEQRSPKWTVLPKMNIWRKKNLENGRFRNENVNKIGQKNLWLDICVEKGLWAKKSA